MIWNIQVWQIFNKEYLLNIQESGRGQRLFHRNALYHWVFCFSCAVSNLFIADLPKRGVSSSMQNKSQWILKTPNIFCYLSTSLPISILLVIRFIVSLKAHRFKLAKIVLLWEYHTLIQGILQQGQNQHKETVSPLPVLKNRGIWCPSFLFVVYFYISIQASISFLFLEVCLLLEELFDISLCF